MRWVVAILLCGACEAVFDYDDTFWHESSPATCTDHIDNDGDGLVDCADPDCATFCDGMSSACGNGRVDTGESCDTAIAVGQPGACPRDCDDANTCTTDHLVGAGTCFASCQHDAQAECCGNGILEAGESCDDGNQLDFDGCTHDCKIERALVLDEMSILPEAQGCDLTGDGQPDNIFGAAMNDQTRAFVSRLLTSHLQSCQETTLFRFVTPDSLLAHATELNVLVGTDPVSPPNLSDYFSGTHPFVVTGTNLTPLGVPVQTLPVSAADRMLSATTTGAVHFPFTYCPTAVIEVTSFSLHGDLSSDGGIDRLTAVACGAMSIQSMHHWANQSGFGGTSILDLAVTGFMQLAYNLSPTQPDMDVDGDGLEHLRDTDGDGNVDLCIDGNGTQIVGTDCPDDPRIADGYSIGAGFDTVAARLVGRAP